MKWTFASVGILIFGLIGIIIITFFNEITVSNEQDYYTLKEAVEASMIEAVDVTYYRLTGSIKIIQEKFVENFTRRFSQVATYGEGNYNIEFYDISESPPKVSVRIVDATATYNIFGTFGADPSKAFVVNEISAILDIYNDGDTVEESGPILLIPSKNLEIVNVPNGALPVYKYDNKYYQSVNGDKISDDIKECQQFIDRLECLDKNGNKVVLQEVSKDDVNILPDKNDSDDFRFVELYPVYIGKFGLSSLTDLDVGINLYNKYTGYLIYNNEIYYTTSNDVSDLVVDNCVVSSNSRISCNGIDFTKKSGRRYCCYSLNSDMYVVNSNYCDVGYSPSSCYGVNTIASKYYTLNDKNLNLYGYDKNSYDLGPDCKFENYATLDVNGICN